jgi:hypothetical protein
MPSPHALQARPFLAPHRSTQPWSPLKTVHDWFPCGHHCWGVSSLPLPKDTMSPHCSPTPRLQDRLYLFQGWPPGSMTRTQTQQPHFLCWHLK